MDYRAFKTNISKTLKWQEALQIIDEFDYNIHQYVDDRIYDPKGGEIYVFYNINSEKQEDYKVDGYLWRNNGGNKPIPKETLARKPVLYKSYYLVLDNQKVKQMKI